MASLMPGGGGVRESLGRILAGSGPMARLARGVLGSGGVWILRLGSTLGLAFLLGHLLGPSEYGVYATVVAHVTLFAPMCCLGYDMLATREFVVARTNGDVEQEVALAHALPRGVWITSAVMLVLFVPASVAWGYFRGKGFEQTILFEALGIALTAHLRLIQGQLRGLGRVSLGQVYQLILPPVLNLVLFVALLAVFPPSAMLAIVTFIAALAIVWPMGLLAVRRNVARGETRASGRTRRTWAHAAIVLGIGQLIFVANEQVPLVVTAALSSTREVGLLDIARRFALFSSIALNVIQLPLGPILAEMYRKQDMAGFRRAALHTTYVAFGLSVVVSLAYLVAGRWLLGVVVPGFEPAYPAMLIMCLGYLINTMTGPVPMVLTMTGHERDIVKGVVVGLVINLGTCLVLVPRIGHVGAAIGAVLGQFAWNSVLAVIVRRRYGVSLDILALFERRQKI